MSLNSWAFTGNLGNDAEMRHTPNGDAVVSFSVGVKSGFGEKSSTTWARCSMFGKRAESVAPYLVKGQLVGVVGELTAREWTDKQGQARTSIDVRVNDLTLLGRRDQSAPQQTAQPAQKSAQGESGFAGMDDDIPFMRFAAGAEWRVV